MRRLDLSQRAHEQEIMDDLGCSGKVVEQTLRELDFINRWLGGNAVTMGGFKELIKKQNLPPGTLSVADLGCGSGDLLCRLAEYGRSCGIKMQLTGIDANPHIIAYAKEHCKDYPEITFEVANVLSDRFSQQSFDVIIGTLFFHHFDDATLRTLLPQLVKQARIGVLINDIHRHAWSYHSIRLLTRIFSCSAMVRYDAPLSVRRAFTRADWTKLFNSTGLKTTQFQWKWAFRWKIALPGTGK